MDKRKLISNTFIKPFTAARGMCKFFHNLSHFHQLDDVAFHYVSASPWQLYQSLSDFLFEIVQFPTGTFHMKTWRPGPDKNFFGLLANPMEFKLSKIEPIFRTFKNRRFILVGDSGEMDPEAYGELWRRFPNMVEHIYIRDVRNGFSKQRFESAFDGVPSECVTIFDKESPPTI